MTTFSISPPPAVPAATGAEPAPAPMAAGAAWNDVVHAAAARLDEGLIEPDIMNCMIASGLAGEFAATLCAYGMATRELAHERDRNAHRANPNHPAA